MTIDTSDIINSRYKKLEALRNSGINPFGGRFDATHHAKDLHTRYDNFSPDESKCTEKVSVAGRLLSLRHHGKSCFGDILDSSGAIQIYIRKDALGDNYKLVDLIDIGDFVGVKGNLFKTRTNELTIEVLELSLLSKSLRPLPEKWHGLKDIEIRYRQRYVDLIVNQSTRETFQLRNKLIRELRLILDNKGFLEVETPMMQSIPGGAAAKPFVTFHNKLKMELYLRIAPELYLKRLIVGGFERVYEINRNFRNEGISTEHNPEFTMLEFYMAYADYNDLMNLTEEMISNIAEKLLNTKKINYQGDEIDLSPPWKRVRFRDSIMDYLKISHDEMDDISEIIKIAEEKDINIPKNPTRAKVWKELFETFIEPQLIQPTFVIDFPIELCPLARRSEINPDYADRFELFVGRKEIANAYTELNDPEEQRLRFEAQMLEREAGDEEAHIMDEDFIRALEYGMPPTAGEGIGIDRLAMLFTDSLSIRDVIFFPQLRPERR